MDYYVHKNNILSIAISHKTFQKIYTGESMIEKFECMLRSLNLVQHSVTNLIENYFARFVVSAKQQLKLYFSVNNLYDNNVGLQVAEWIGMKFGSQCVWIDVYMFSQIALMGFFSFF